jgi:hypothetical protein
VVTGNSPRSVNREPEPRSGAPAGEDVGLAPKRAGLSKRTQKIDRPSPAMVEAFSLYAVEDVEHIVQTAYLRIVQTAYLWEGL